MEIRPDRESLIYESPVKDKPFRILIVEDNPGDVHLVREFLKSSGIDFSLKSVSTVKETINQCAREDFDILLLDLGLPDSKGLETLIKIKEKIFKSPIVVMTGLDDEDIALESLRTGAQDYLVKNNLNSENILRSIKYSIERKKIEELLKKNTRQFSILSSATAAINECENISSIYEVTCRNINLLLEKAGVIVFQLTGTEKVYTSGIDWLGLYKSEIKQGTGLDLQTPELRSGKLKPNIKDLFNHEKLQEIGLNNLLTVWATGLIKSERIYGGLLIIIDNNLYKDDASIIMSIVNQASLSLHRKFIEKEVKSSENRYRKLSGELEIKVRNRTQDLEILNEQLKQELMERKVIEESLEESKIRLTELIATKDKFFNIIAHDLKNPFTCLLGSTEILNDNINQMNKEKIRKLVQILNDSAKSGYAILQNLLDWARTQTGLIVFNPEKISLKKLVDENIHEQQLSSSKKEINIFSELHEDLFVVADKNMLNTVLRNLLSNAIKFTHNFGTVIINAEIKGADAVISVKDSGIGIPKSGINKLFRIDTKYTRPGTDKEQGTGLGLKVSKEFVEMHGGKIWVKSTINKGSEFIFLIPVENTSRSKNQGN